MAATVPAALTSTVLVLIRLRRAQIRHGELPAPMLRFACLTARGDRGVLHIYFRLVLCPTKRKPINSRNNTAESDKSTYVNPHQSCVFKHLQD